MTPYYTILTQGGVVPLTATLSGTWALGSHIVRSIYLESPVPPNQNIDPPKASIVMTITALSTAPNLCHSLGCHSVLLSNIYNSMVWECPENGAEGQGWGTCPPVHIQKVKLGLTPQAPLDIFLGS